MLACALPFVLIAAWRSRTRRWGLLLFVASLVVLDIALDEIPRVGVFQHLHWKWREGLYQRGNFSVTTTSVITPP